VPTNSDEALSGVHFVLVCCKCANVQLCVYVRNMQCADVQMCIPGCLLLIINFLFPTEEGDEEDEEEDEKDDEEDEEDDEDKHPPQKKSKTAASKIRRFQLDRDEGRFVLSVVIPCCLQKSEHLRRGSLQQTKSQMLNWWKISRQ